MTTKQKQIVARLEQTGDEMTKQEVFEMIGNGAYCNAGEHVGRLLSRMVKTGLLVRIKRGHFKLGTGKKIKDSSPKTDKSQIRLFE